MRATWSAGRPAATQFPAPRASRIFPRLVTALVCLAVEASLISCARVLCFLRIYNLVLYSIFPYNHGFEESECKGQCSEEDGAY